ncbi:MAG: cytochrome c oxidase assembly protein [Azospirillum sp.]|nr:cytochrome c oxidase assembly protein [Azospirillum sp.]
MNPGLGRKNRVVMAAAFAVVAAMVGLSFASVPLYRIFCQVTGFGGTTQRAAQPAGTVAERMITVRFNADVNSDLPWRFRAVQSSVKVHLGESRLIGYQATNLGKEPVVGTAVFNVQPDKAGLYFNKIQCFCFTEQTLAPGETAELPVYFFVDPALDKDPDLDGADTITLSYTFYRSASPALDRAVQTTFENLDKTKPVPAAVGAKPPSALN